MKAAWWGGVLLLGLGSAAATWASDDAVQREQQRLQGTWKAIDIQHDGDKQMPAGGLQWVFRDNQYEVRIGGKRMEQNQFQLHPAKKTLDVQHGGSSRGQKVKGIYELDGNTLKICYDLTGRHYPKDFTAPQGTRRIVYVFRRE